MCGRDLRITDPFDLMGVCSEREAKYGSQAPSIVIMTAALLAEWLRRLTRNQLGASRVGSSPAECALFAADAEANIDVASSTCKLLRFPLPWFLAEIFYVLPYAFELYIYVAAAVPPSCVHVPVH